MRVIFTRKKCFSKGKKEKCFSITFIENYKLILITQYPGFSQARSKVHVFKTLFPSYMEKVHPYEEPVPPLPLCAFKFEASKFGVVRDMYDKYCDVIERFGVFEFDQPPHARRLVSSPEDFENKVSLPSILIRQIIR